MQFGLALSGGGLRGTAHIGALKALEESRLLPSYISGTSAGSIVAALYSCGYKSNEMRDIALTKYKKSMVDIDVKGLLKAATSICTRKGFNYSGFIKGNKLTSLFKDITGNKHIKEAMLPIAITAVDINNGQTIYFTNRKTSSMKDTKFVRYIDDVKLYEAIAASIAIPITFKPVIFRGMTLVDGGVNDFMPAEILKKMGARYVAAVNLGYSGQMRSNIDNILEIGNQTIDIMGYQITRLTNKYANVIINPHIYNVGLKDIDKIEECIQKGYETMHENLYMLKKVLIS